MSSIRTRVKVIHRGRAGRIGADGPTGAAGRDGWRIVRERLGSVAALEAKYPDGQDFAVEVFHAEDPTHAENGVYVWDEDEEEWVKDSDLFTPYLILDPFVWKGEHFIRGMMDEDGNITDLVGADGRRWVLDPLTGELFKSPTLTELRAHIATKVEADYIVPEPLFFADGIPLRRATRDENDDAIGNLAEDGESVAWDSVLRKHFRVLKPADIADLTSGASSRTFDITSSNALILANNSLGQGGHNLAGKHFSGILQALTPWRVVNLSVGGQDPEQTLKDIVENVAENGGQYGIRSLKGSILAGFDLSNSSWLLRELLDHSFSVEQCIQAGLALGARLLLYTEPRDHPWEMNAPQNALARKYGLPFVDLNSGRRRFGVGSVSAYHQGSGVATHPGGREQWDIVNRLRRKVLSMGRPARSIKLATLRAGKTLDDAPFDYQDFWRYYETWRELQPGHKALSGTDRKYYDDLQHEPVATQDLADEHLDLAAGEALVTDKPVLVQAIVDGTAQSLEQVTVDTRTTGADLVAYVITALGAIGFNPDQPGGWQVAETDGVFTVVAGDTYEDEASPTPNVYTVVGTSTDAEGRPLVVFTPATSNLGAETLTLLAGTGDETIECLRFTPGLHPSFYDRQGRACVLREIDGTGGITIEDGVVTLSTATGLQNGMRADQIDIVLTSSGNLTVAGTPEATETGVGGKNIPPIPEPELYTGNVVLNLLANDGSWDVVDKDGAAVTPVAPAAPADGWLPEGVTQVVKIDSGHRYTVPITVDPDALTDSPAQLQITARYAPAKYSSAGTYPTGSAQTEDTVDFGYLHAMLSAGHTQAPRAGTHFVEGVGLSFDAWTFVFDLPSDLVLDDADLTLTVWATRNELEFAHARIVQKI